MSIIKKSIDFICYKCEGTGTLSENKKCDVCNGTGKFKDITYYFINSKTKQCFSGDSLK